MTLLCPDEWSVLRYPDMRFELMQSLAAIEATPVGSNPTYEQLDIDDIIHFFFDDTSLSERDVSTVGQVLFDTNEEEAIHHLTSELEALLHDVGDKPTTSFVGHSRWSLVRRAAREALELLKLRGDAVITRGSAS